MCQRRAAGFAAGQLRGILIAVQTELLQNVTGLIMVVAGRKACFDIGQRGCKP